MFVSYIAHSVYGVKLIKFIVFQSLSVVTDSILSGLNFSSSVSKLIVKQSRVIEGSRSGEDHSGDAGGATNFCKGNAGSAKSSTSRAKRVFRISCGVQSSRLEAADPK